MTFGGTKLWPRPLDLGLEGGERIAPEAVEPAAQLAEAFRVDLVEAARAVDLVADEAGLAQRLEVLRDGRPAHRQAGGDLADRHRAGAQALEDGASGRVGQGGEGVLVSHGLL